MDNNIDSGIDSSMNDGVDSDMKCKDGNFEVLFVRFMRSKI
jgi:hypothetical protein